jgi:hypothetical protein
MHCLAPVGFLCGCLCPTNAPCVPASTGLQKAWPGGSAAGKGVHSLLISSLQNNSALVHSVDVTLCDFLLYCLHFSHLQLPAKQQHSRCWAGSIQCTNSSSAPPDLGRAPQIHACLAEYLL